jgi:hypothetical protein
MLFNSRKPRHFQHTPIYIDERRDRLNALEQRCRKELGMDVNNKDVDESQFQKAFSDAVHHPRSNNRKINHLASNHVLMIIILVLLVTVLYYLLAR